MGNSEFKDGWLLVLVGWFVIFMVDGVIFSFGVLLVEILDDLGDHRGATAFVGSILLGVFAISGPVVGSLADKFGARPLIITGTLVSFAGFFASVFAETLPVMCLTYGLLGGIGFSLVLLPSHASVMKHFNKRRALAGGLTICGSGIGTFTFNILMSRLSAEFGWRMALLIISGMVLNGIPCGLLLVESKDFGKAQNQQNHMDNIVTDGEHGTNSAFKTAMHDFKYMVQETVKLVKHKSCLVIMVSSVFIGFAFTIPYILLPDQAVQSGMSIYEASWLVSTIGMSNVIARVIFGCVSDKIFLYRKALFESTILIQGITVAMLPLASAFETKLLLTSIFGLANGGCFMLILVVLADAFGPEQIGKSYGLFLFCLGISAIFAAPLAGWIYDVSGNYSLPFYVAGAEFCLAAACNQAPRIINALARRERTDIITITHM